MSSSRRFRVLGVLKDADAKPVVFETDLRLAASPDNAGRSPIAVPGDSGWRSATAADLVTEVRESARAEGYSAGWSEGRRVAAADARVEAEAVARDAAAAEQARIQRHASTLEAVAVAATQLERRAVPVFEEFTESILAVATELAEAVLGRELALATDGGADALRRALELAPRQRPVTVRLNPEDLATLAVLDSTVEIDGRTVTLVPDASLQRGDAVAVCDTTEVDARLTAALDRARKALTP
jgi:flagellar assembly protein FliH